jgi:hypoxanthine phosphoribosyltransferase
MSAGKLLFTRDTIQGQIKRIANRISYDYLSDKVVLLGILKGCHPFLSDLAKAISIPCEIEYIMASSYGNNRVAGELHITAKTYDTLHGKNVIIVDDIIDTGKTLHEVTKRVEQQGANTIATCVLLDKQRYREVHTLQPTYSCFTIENGFVYGYGLDLDGFKRNLQDIFVVGDNETV